MSHIVKVTSIEHLTHDVLKIVGDKPAGLSFNPGQAVDFAINKEGWKDAWRSFTFTSLPEDNYVEFNIKTYPERKGVTNELLNLKQGEEIILGDVYGDIAYKGEGIFIAGGAGITPFLSIFRSLKKKNAMGKNLLIFANKTKGDIIQKDVLKSLLGLRFVNILSNEELAGYEHGFVSAALIKKYMSSNTPYFYLCAPPPMMTAVETYLTTLGVSKDNVIKEGF